MEAFKDRGLKVVSIHATFHKAEDVGLEELKAHVAELKVPFPVGLDARRDGDDATSTLLRYKTEKLPLLVVIDKKGVVRFAGDETSDEAQVQALLEQLLKEE